MAENFIDVPITSTTEELADGAIERLQQEWEDYDPEDGDLEVVQIEALAPLAQNAAVVASQVPPGLFRAYGEKLVGELYQEGTPAAAVVAFTITDASPHTIPAGTEIDIDGFAFTTVEDRFVSALSIGGVDVVANEETSEANDLPGDSVVLVSSLAFIADVTLTSGPSGGTDAEDDEAYQDRLSRELQLQAKTLVTTGDYEMMALSVPGIGRAVAVANTSTRVLHVTLITPEGLAVPTPTKNALLAVYEELRLTNWTVSADDATYKAINVTYTVKKYPGFESTAVKDACDALLTDYLSPLGFGRQSGINAENAGWLTDDRIRKNKIIDLLGDAEGVNYVVSVTLSATSITLESNGDLVMPGTVPLPTTGTLTGTVT